MFQLSAAPLIASRLAQTPLVPPNLESEVDVAHRATVRTIIHKLGLPSGAAWSDVLVKVREQYGKPLYFVAEPAGGRVSGLWVDAGDFGAVICRGERSVCTQNHVILHELAHILIDHDPDAPDHTEEMVESLAYAIASLLYSDPVSDEEAHFG